MQISRRQLGRFSLAMPAFWLASAASALACHDCEDDPCCYGDRPAPPSPPPPPPPPEPEPDPQQGGGFSTGPADPGSGVDPLNDSTGGRMWDDGSILQLASSDPTRNMSDSGWANIFDVSNPQNSCLISDYDSLAPDAHDATQAEPAETSFWDAKWFSFTASANLGEGTNGAVQTDLELGNRYGTLWVPVAEGGVVEGGFYYTFGSEISKDPNATPGTMDPYGAFGAYFGKPGGAEFFVQSELTNAAPNLEFGVRAGIGELSVGVDAGPMVESGGRALENLQNNLYDYTQLMSGF